MHTLYRTVDGRTSFIIADVDPAYHQAVRDLAYSPVAEGFAKSYPADTPNLERIYHTFARFAEPMVLQAAGVMPVPWQAALARLLDRLAGARIDWWLAGSSALAVRGLPVAPHDFDLIVDDAGAQRLGEILGDCLIEPVQPVTGWFCNWWGRAFMEARLEWVGGVDERGDQPEISDFGPTAAGRLETIEWQGHTLRVPPLELQLAVSRRRGLAERARLIQGYLEGSR